MSLSSDFEVFSLTEYFLFVRRSVNKVHLLFYLPRLICECKRLLFSKVQFGLRGSVVAVEHSCGPEAPPRVCRLPMSLEEGYYEIPNKEILIVPWSK